MSWRREGLASALVAAGWERRDFDHGSSLLDAPRPLPRLGDGGAVHQLYLGPRGAVEARILGRRTPVAWGAVSDGLILSWLGIGGAS